MLIPQKISKKKLMILVIILILAVGLIGYLLIYSFIGGGPNLYPQNVPPELVEIPVINTDFVNDFLNKEPYTKLKAAGSLPVVAGDKGRDNPFAPVYYRELPTEIDE